MKPSLRCSLLLAAALPVFWASNGQAQTQLLLNGNFTATPAVSGNNLSVGRTGSGQTTILDGTAGAATGWFTTGSNSSGTVGAFELWASGYGGSPTVTGNSLELANNGGGSTTYQDVTALSTGALSTFSFGYATRDSGTDAFTASIIDRTTGTTLFTQAFNPTGSFATNQLFSTNLSVKPGDTYRIQFLDQNTTPAGLIGLTYPANSLSAHIDQVSLVQGVPEPSTWAGIVLGAAGLCLLQRLRRTA